MRAIPGLSAAEFGQLVGASGQSIYNWETGKAVQSLAAAFTRVYPWYWEREAAKRLSAME
ncbi:MAG: hypothetical protein EON58_10835 [Alphaproteobacteria bacterium]|nr:MAG: hypothetical protein EON58_10835 [Alphaproteobacteria bacterium]